MSATGVSTHVLDTAKGKPAAGIGVVLEAAGNGSWTELARGTTDADGRLAGLLPAGPPAAGDFRLRFDTGPYLRASGHDAFYPEVVVHVRLDAGAKYHLPLLLSPFGYSTYRGS